jgi:2-dehydro-3-deoxygalactonokinase
MSEAAYVAVDWGTSSFRLWLVDRTGNLLGERRSHEGMMTAGKLGFATVLQSHLDAVGAAPGLPVVVCGMAGARQGWVEAGYVDTPARLASILQHAVPVPGQNRDIRILPGIAQRDPKAPDVMRGEETQLLGALGVDAADDAVVCMPGTHSKWVRAKDGTVERFATFMTGELFDVVSGKRSCPTRWPAPMRRKISTPSGRRSLPRSRRRRWPPICCSRCDRANSCTAARHPRPVKKYPAP